MSGDQAQASQELELGDLPPADPIDQELELGHAPGAPGEPGPAAIAGPSPESLGLAAMAAEIGARIAQGRWPELTFSQDEKLGATNAIAPVLQKYDIGAAWMETYREEVALGTFLVGLFVQKRQELATARAHQDKKPDPGKPEPGSQNNDFQKSAGSGSESAPPGEAPIGPRGPGLDAPR